LRHSAITDLVDSGHKSSGLLIRSASQTVQKSARRGTSRLGGSFSFDFVASLVLGVWASTSRTASLSNQH